MATHPDRPGLGRQKVRLWRVVLKDGRELVITAFHRAMARHYSRSLREEYVGSDEHYRDVKSTRLVRQEVEAYDDVPF